MPANIDSMAYYGDVRWHGLGAPVPERATGKEMIRAAGLDWRVEKRAARGATVDKQGRASRHEIIRLPRKGRAESEILLGLVSQRYEPLQNDEAFAFLDPVLGEEHASFETAGALGQGERIWALAKMPDAIEVVRGDECLKYLLLSNSHDGEGSVAIKFTSIRVVCQNTLMLAMQDGQKAYRVRQSKIMSERLREVAEILGAIHEVYARTAEIFRRLAKVPVLNGKLTEYLEAVFPRSEAQKRDRTTPDRWTAVRQAFDEVPDLQLPGVQGTLWAAYNAVTRFEHYRKPRGEERPDQRLERTWFGAGADLKLRALNVAQELAA